MPQEDSVLTIAARGRTSHLLVGPTRIIDDYAKLTALSFKLKTRNDTVVISGCWRRWFRFSNSKMHVGIECRRFCPVASNQMQRFDGRLERAEWRAEKVRVVVGCSGRSVLMKLKEMLRNERLIDVVAACPTGDEILRACEELKPSLVMLDTRITSPDALSVASTLHAHYGAKVVLLSEPVATQAQGPALVAVEYNPQTFDANCLFETARDTLDAVDCGDLMGGLGQNQAEQKQAMGSRMASQKTHHHNQLASLSSDNSARHRMLRKLLVRDSGVVKVVPFDDIAWVDAAGDYMCVHALGETLVMRSTLRELIDKLDERTFARIHRSTIVNVEKIISLTPLAKGAGLLELACGKTLKVSRNYRDSVKNLFQ